jgi:very-short-patch-repair endonuclease
MRTHRRNIEFSRELRRQLTSEERKLWTFLRTRPLNFKFRRQHTIGPWIADLACPEARLVIEIDGGGHAEPDTAERDARRTMWLQQHEWKVLRFWNFELRFEWEAVLQRIFDELTNSSPSPRPSPRFAGRGS